MLVLNFSHALSDSHTASIAELVNDQVTIIQYQVHFDDEVAFSMQTRDLLEQHPFSNEDWQTGKFLINLPGHPVIAGVLLAELHGRMGHFPTVLRLQTVPGITPPQFEIAELIDLHCIRTDSRKSIRGCRQRSNLD